ncbi:MAG: translation elongation factor 4, partial [Candidatus Paceibacterota bacterium]
GETYEFNLIDTPGHIDFSYEVSRSLRAVEGVILLVDATQGVQAQTFSVLNMARELNLPIIPVLNKIDLPSARIEEVTAEIVETIGCTASDILAVSGKTGFGVEDLLRAVVTKIPAPQARVDDVVKGLVFDFQYSNHKGLIVYTRIFGGEIKKGDKLKFIGSKASFTALEVGAFIPEMAATGIISSGEIGYIVTGLKQTTGSAVGDTICSLGSSVTPIPGYMTPAPVVWASIYPESQDDFMQAKQALERLKLEDSSLSFEEESSGALGRGFRCGFLGMLHLEIVTERLKREFDLSLIIATPSISYIIEHTDRNNDRETIYSPHMFPEDLKNKKVLEQWVLVKLIMPAEYLNTIMSLLYDHEADVVDMENFGHERTKILVEMPLRELMRNFFDEIKSATSGFASLSYEFIASREADVVRLDILVAEEPILAFSRVVARRRVEQEGEQIVDKLKKLLPRQLIVVKIQAKSMGRILASRTLSAMKKDVAGYLYGGDITRKMKLREKQKKGKKKMQALGRVNIPQSVFLKMMKSTE